VWTLISEEMSNLKGEKKQLEEENMSYMQKTLDLEEVTMACLLLV